jgi:hypothetical protein
VKVSHYFLILEIPLIKRAQRSIKFENILEVIMKHDSLYGNESRDGRKGGKEEANS